MKNDLEEAFYTNKDSLSDHKRAIRTAITRNQEQTITHFNNVSARTQ